MRNAYGQQLCEVCETRLNRTKGMKYSCPPGLMCHKCYNKEHPRNVVHASIKRPASPLSDAAPVPAPKRVRRTQSDPGEPINLTCKRTCAEPPTIGPAVRKTCVRAPVDDPPFQLHGHPTHAQPLALLAAVATDAAHCVIPNASAVVFDT
jgi:hypothetical protein